MYALAQFALDAAQVVGVVVVITGGWLSAVILRARIDLAEQLAATEGESA